MESYYELKRMLCKELDEIAKEGKISSGSLDAIDKITHSIKSLVTIMAMEEGGYSGAENGYNGNSGARRRDSMGRYADGGSYGRYYDDRNMSGYSGRRYSRDEGKSHMIKEFEKLMDKASSQEEKEVIMSALNQLNEM